MKEAEAKRRSHLDAISFRPTHDGSGDEEDMLNEEKTTEEAARPNPLEDALNKLKFEATDFKLRFCGHCNTTTDIKEANFFGR